MQSSNGLMSIGKACLFPLRKFIGKSID
jgi:hypothetical protein